MPSFALKEDSEELIEFAAPLTLTQVVHTVHAEEFRRLMLEDEWLAAKLRSACEQQLKQARSILHEIIDYILYCSYILKLNYIIS